MTFTLSHHLPGQPALALWRLPCAGRPVLYIHGSTFPAQLSAGYRFDGVSWADHLSEAGFDIWGLDFAGYGHSRQAGDTSPFHSLDDAADQIDRAIAFIAFTTGYTDIFIIAHSWGSLPAGLAATRRPVSVTAMVLFGPIAQRNGVETPELDGWRLITVEDQYNRFVADVPDGGPAVLSQMHFDAWAADWLTTDPTHFERQPPSVRIPNAPYNHLAAAWAGRPGYDPADIACPTLVVRGEWDSVCDASDVDWFRSRIRPELFEAETIRRGTHLLHLEANRVALYHAVTTFFHKQTKA